MSICKATFLVTVLYDNAECSEASLSVASLEEIGHLMDDGPIIGMSEYQGSEVLGEPGSEKVTQELLAVGNDGDFFGPYE